MTHLPHAHAVPQVDCDTGHYHAHAAIVVRSATRFGASHGHIVQFAVMQMLGL